MAKHTAKYIPVSKCSPTTVRTFKIKKSPRVSSMTVCCLKSALNKKKHCTKSRLVSITYK